MKQLAVITGNINNYHSFKLGQTVKVITINNNYAWVSKYNKFINILPLKQMILIEHLRIIKTKPSTYTWVTCDLFGNKTIN